MNCVLGALKLRRGRKDPGPPRGFKDLELAMRTEEVLIRNDSRISVRQFKLKSRSTRQCLIKDAASSKCQSMYKVASNNRHMLEEVPK